MTASARRGQCSWCRRRLGWRSSVRYGAAGSPSTDAYSLPTQKGPVLATHGREGEYGVVVCSASKHVGQSGGGLPAEQGEAAIEVDAGAIDRLVMGLAEIGGLYTAVGQPGPPASVLVDPKRTA